MVWNILTSATLTDGNFRHEDIVNRRRASLRSSKKRLYDTEQSASSSSGSDDEAVAPARKRAKLSRPRASASSRLEYNVNNMSQRQPFEPSAVIHPEPSPRSSLHAKPRLYQNDRRSIWSGFPVSAEEVR